MRSALLCRGAALVAASALSITTLGVLSSPAEAHPAGDRAVNAGATWLKAQLKDGLLVNSFGPQVGPSIDAGLAFDELGRAADAAVVADGIAPGLVTTANGEYGYVKATEYDWMTGAEVQVGKYANPTAKAAAFVVRVGRNPRTAYADIDLVAQLEELTDDATGEIADNSSYGNYANTIGQAFAVEALTAVTSSEATAATAFLMKQQCPAGYFRFALSSTSCADATHAAHLDATSLAVLSLVSSGSTAPSVTNSITKAGNWLATQQAADGSFSAGGTEGINANSTGLAGWALAEAGNAAAATKAASWLRGVQIADLAPCATTLSADNGALAPNPTALSAARTAGAIPAGQRFAYAFATAQALPALAHVPAGSGALTLAAPTTAVEKSTVTVTVSGLGAGEAGCVSFGSLSKPVTGTGSDLAVTFELPAGAGSHAFTLRTLAGAQTATTQATLTPVPATPAPTPTPTASPTPTPVPATPEVGKLAVKNVVTVKNNRFKMSLTCDDSEWCDGKVVVRTTRKVAVGDTARTRKVLVAKTSYAVAPGTTKKLVLKVRKPARQVLTEGRVRVKAVQSAPDADRAVTKFWLRAK